MLIITRRPGERIMLGVDNDIVIELMEVSGHTARLGIRAPRSIPVYREEIWVQIREENRATADAADQASLSVPAKA